MSFAATTLEYRYRYWLHGLVYALGFGAPWERTWFHLGQHTLWVKLASSLSEWGWLDFGQATGLILVIATLLAGAGAYLRTWGASYLSASVVQRGGMVGNRVISDGPFRHLRNPLYIGTILHTLAIVILMKPSGAFLVVLLIVILQLRLIAREEPYLTAQLGPVYVNYCKNVPSLIPSLRPRVAPAGLRPQWLQGVVSEVYMIGTAVSFAVLGWTYDSTTILQGLLISLGFSIAVRAFIPK